VGQGRQRLERLARVAKSRESAERRTMSTWPSSQTRVPPGARRQRVEPQRAQGAIVAERRVGRGRGREAGWNVLRLSNAHARRPKR
jgi:hypothetical protein